MKKKLDSSRISDKDEQEGELRMTAKDDQYATGSEVEGVLREALESLRKKEHEVNSLNSGMIADPKTRTLKKEVTNAELAEMHPIDAQPVDYDHAEVMAGCPAWEARYQRLAAVCKPNRHNMQYTVSVFDFDVPETILHVGTDRIRALMVLEDLTQHLADGELKARLTQQARK